MARKKRLGIDIGSESLHIVVWNGSLVTDIITELLPEGLVREGRIISFDALSDFMKDVRKKHHLRIHDVALVLNNNDCYCRRFTMPAMSIEHLKINIPYEFRDFVQEDKNKYNYDYAIVDVIRDENDQPKELDLMAACVLRELVENYAMMFHRAGFRLCEAVPETMAYVNLLRRYPNGDDHSHVILDMGSRTFRMLMFAGDRYVADRQLDMGFSDIDRLIADERNIDPHIARAYRESDVESQTLPSCMELYGQMALEVLKAVNFYNFNNREQQLEDVHCCGGGSQLAPLMDTMRSMLPVNVEGMEELIPDLSADLREKAVYAGAALGAVLQ